MTGVKFCPHCGAAADFHCHFCANCGKPFSTPDSTKKKKRRRRFQPSQELVKSLGYTGLGHSITGFILGVINVGYHLYLRRFYYDVVSASNLKIAYSPFIIPAFVLCIIGNFLIAWSMDHDNKCTSLRVSYILGCIGFILTLLSFFI